MQHKKNNFIFLLKNTSKHPVRASKTSQKIGGGGGSPEAKTHGIIKPSQEINLSREAKVLKATF
jgi:hypothetical protein